MDLNKGTTGILLVALGLIMLYVVLSDKYLCFVGFFDCLFGTDAGSGMFTQSNTPYTPGASANKTPGGTPPFIQSGDRAAMSDMWGMLKKVLGMTP